ncbi:MAG: bifunctional adenosylcobinamide kinase/adenosylcobinamide-phosphate guanylyltransferase [Anaerolineae bacterium]|nr:bifunctional adenosylcobinamide kinase/adenosylcobinamide-phosphate guanylyltransferase [Anaerolineae bacterium]
MPKLILLLGGARSGKSTLAERMAAELGSDVLYVATAQAFDDEMRERIAAHQRSRAQGWHTLEAPLRVAEQLRAMALPPVILIDCITLLATNALLTLPDDCTQAEANQAILSEIDGLLTVEQTSDSTWIVVSNEVGMGVVPPYRLGRLYRDALGAANQRLAKAADEVYLLVAGLPWRLK